MAAKTRSRFPGLTEFVQDNIDKPTRYIARAYCADRPQFDVEQVRTAIRYRLLQRGSALNKFAKKKYSDLSKLRKVCMRPSGLPDTVEGEIKPFKLPTGVDAWFMMADAHIPFHVPGVIETAVAWFKERYVKNNIKVGVILNGDWADCYSCSSYLRDPRKTNLEVELDYVNDSLDFLGEQLTPERFIYKLGNHENRLANLLKSRAPELLGVTGFSWPLFLNAKERPGFHIVDWAVPIQHKNLDILHGDELRSSHHPVNPARTAMTKTKFCTIVAHSHQTSQHSEQNSRRVPLTAWSMGCACGLTPEYNPMAYLKWNHGFAVLDLTDSWKVLNMRVRDAKEVL